MRLQNVPDDFVVHQVVTVDQDVAKGDYAGRMGNLICRGRVSLGQALQGLANDLKLAFDG